MRTRRRRAVAITALAGVGLSAVLGACGSSAGPAPTLGLPAGVTVTLSLVSDHVVGGSALRGELTVTNHTGRPILVRSCPADGLFEVGIESAAVPFIPADGLVACTTRLPRGRTSMPVEIEALYAGCGGKDQPRCRRGRDPVPPLPAGSYETTVDLDDVPRAVAPDPHRVTVVDPVRG